MTTPMRRPPELRRLQLAGIAFGIVLVAGVVGYRTVVGMSIVDAIYMTVITVTTVGFSEVVPLGESGRVLTIFLIAGGVSTVSYAALTAAEFVVEGHLGNFIERRRMDRRIAQLTDHVVVCGFGRVGRHLSDALARDGVPHVVVESDPAKQVEVEIADRLVVLGDATEEATLEEAGIQRARSLVACVNADADNVLVTLTVRGLRPDIDVVARAKSDENERKLVRAGANRVILPASIGGRRIATLLTRPTVSDFLDGLGAGAVDYTLEEVAVVAGGPIAGTPLRDAGIRQRHGCTVLAVQRADGRLDTNPSATEALGAGDVLVVFGTEDDVRALRRRAAG